MIWRSGCGNELHRSGERSPCFPRHIEGRIQLKVNDVRKMAKGLNINTYRMTKPNMIRSIQKAENSTPCFGTPRVDECYELTGYPLASSDHNL